MEILTHDGRRLWVIRFGEAGKLSRKILCENGKGEKVTVTFSEIKEIAGSYSMPPKDKK